MVVVDEEYALSVIRKSKHFQQFEEGKKVKSVSIRVLSDDQGYVAVVHHAIVHFECGTDFSFIIKAPSLERCVDTFALDNDDPNSLTLVHNRECEVYEFLDKCNVLAPKLYDMRLATDLVKDPGYILMESFVGRGVVLGLRHQVSSKQVINVAHHLGKMRAEVGKIKDVKPWNDPFRVEGTLVDELFEKNIPFLLEYDKRTFGPLVDQLKPFTNKKFFGYLQKGRAEELGVATLTHADLHSGNVMTKPNPDGSPSDEVATFFDWQLGFFGNALFDLARFACVSADADIRRGIEDVALDEYYDAYIKHSERPDPKFTRDVCQELYDLGIVMEALEFQFLFHLVSGNLNPRNDRHLESLLARFALRARLTMEDGIRAIEKYKLLDVAKNKCLKTV